MQTFLPYNSFEKSLHCLDLKRLGKQRVEAWQIINTIHLKKKAWSNHPAVNMWRPYLFQLCVYYNKSLDVWAARKKKNIKLRKIVLSQLPSSWSKELPHFMGNQAFHDSHKSNLLRKHPRFYQAFGWQVPDNLPYIWPIKPC